MSKNYCAELLNNEVINVIVADYAWATTNLDGEWHDLGGEPLTVGIGFTYDAVNDVFVAPVIEEDVASLIDEDTESEQSE